MISVNSCLSYIKLQNCKFFFLWGGLSYADQGRVGAQNTPPSGQSSAMRDMISCSPPGFQGWKDNILMCVKFTFSV